MDEAETARWQARPSNLNGSGVSRSRTERSGNHRSVEFSLAYTQKRSCQIARHAVEKTIAFKVDFNVFPELPEVNSRKGPNRIRAGRSGLFEGAKIVGPA